MLGLRVFGVLEAGEAGRENPKKRVSKNKNQRFFK